MNQIENFFDKSRTVLNRIENIELFQPQFYAVLESFSFVDVGINLESNDTFVLEYNDGDATLHNCLSLSIIRESGSIINLSNISEIIPPSITYSGISANK